jgi:hypothetical protein
MGMYKSFQEPDPAVAGRILEKLEPRVVKVEVRTFDWGKFVGVAIELRADGKRHAVKVANIPTWEAEAIDALLEWLEAKGD